MERIGIIGAMEVEVSRLKEKMENVKITKKASMDFYEGTLFGKTVVVVRSGIGKVNAAACTQILADVFQVEAVINTGASIKKSISEILFLQQTFFITIWTRQDLAIRRDRFHRCRSFLFREMQRFEVLQRESVMR